MGTWPQPDTSVRCNGSLCYSRSTTSISDLCLHAAEEKPTELQSRPLLPQPVGKGLGYPRRPRSRVQQYLHARQTDNGSRQLLTIAEMTIQRRHVLFTRVCAIFDRFAQSGARDGSAPPSSSPRPGAGPQHSLPLLQFFCRTL